MTKYINYNSTTDEIIGFYDSDIHTTIPDPNVEITDQEHTTFLDGMNNDNKIVKIIGGVPTLIDIVDNFSWDDIRAERNSLLKQSDYTQLVDYPGADKESYRLYRQVLRDIPQTFIDPNNITWPDLNDF